MPVISVEDIWKQYRFGTTGYRTLRHDLQSRWARMRGKEDPNGPVVHTRPAAASGGGEASAERFWALRGVSFQVEQGEIVGIIGRNGAGKSTLLKVMSRVTSPTKGCVRIKGRIASLLEVGTGFHPELTGRENVFLNGAILGMTREEIRRRFDQIVAFAEIESFIDTPVKRYSSGMQVRLGFAVAAHLDPEILLVDEVLAVGDVGFQRKCMGKIGAVGREGRTVLFVSHNLGTIAKLCSRGIVLGAGAVVRDGAVVEALSEYTRGFDLEEGFVASDFRGNMRARLRFDTIAINGSRAVSGAQVSPAVPLRITIGGEALEPIASYRTTVRIHRDGLLLLALHDAPAQTPLAKGKFESEVTVPPYFLSPGDYTVTFGGYSDVSREYLWSANHLLFTMLAEWSEQFDTTGSMGVVNLPGVGLRRATE